MMQRPELLDTTGCPLATDWSLAMTAAGDVASPDALGSGLDWLRATVPGTVAAALAAAGKWSLDNPTPLHQNDYWYRCAFVGDGPARLVFDGLATIAEVWLNGERILDSRSMFAAQKVDVTLRGANELYICFRSLDAALAKAPTRPRARWRPRLIASQSLRWIRSTLIGHMPTWCPPVHAIGPWRPIRLIRLDQQHILEKSVRTRLESETGLVDVRIRLSQPCATAPIAHCAGHAATLIEVEPNLWAGTIEVPRAERWWPHTHGAPRLYALTLDCGDTHHSLGNVGFRTIGVDRGHDGRDFRILVNGVPVFCRGAVWSNSDIVSLSGERTTYEPALTALRDANLNMVRVPGTMVYEADAFHDLCDELGLLIWQDFMFANFDYPADNATWCTEVESEAASFLARTQQSPSLAVLCGGSEVDQQATMLGYPASATASKLFDELLPAAAARFRPDVAYVKNSPHGGSLPFSVSSGVSHYFGVGAYLRPLDDARRAAVRFASECLAFANIPEPVTLDRALPVTLFHHPKWKERTPRDQGASWDFEDVRDHYLEDLYGVDARQLRTSDPERYLHASRSVVADVFEATLGEWRRYGSTTSGALVLMAQDLWAGAGWGIIDSTGEPKSPWYAMRRVSQPVTVVLTDEGLDGLACHVINESQSDRRFTLRLRCLRDGETPVIDKAIPIAVTAHSAVAVSSSEIIGQFFDITSAYRFGPASHDVSIATLVDATDGTLVAEAFHMPSTHLTARAPIGLTANVVSDGAETYLQIAAKSFARRVTIDDRHYRPEDNYFNLDPAAPRLIKLTRRDHAVNAAPSGEVTALNATGIVRYGGTR